MLEIIIQKGDITDVQAQAIVNPANTYGWMGGGTAGAIKEKGGQEIEREVIDHGTMELGRAVATSAGKLPHQFIIHAPTMENPADKATAYNVAMAVKGALHLADDLKLTSLAMPGMGTGVGGFSVTEAAKIMLAEIKNFQPLNLQKIFLMDINQAMVDAWQKELK